MAAALFSCSSSNFHLQYIGCLSSPLWIVISSLPTHYLKIHRCQRADICHPMSAILRLVTMLDFVIEMYMTPVVGRLGPRQWRGRRCVRRGRRCVLRRGAAGAKDILPCESSREARFRHRSLKSAALRIVIFLGLHNGTGIFQERVR